MNYIKLIFYTLSLVSLTALGSDNENIVKQVPDDESLYCLSGAYQLEDESIFIITPLDLPNLRYRQPDGRSGKLFYNGDNHFISGEGWSNKENPVIELMMGDCEDKHFKLLDNTETKKATKINFPIEEVMFKSGNHSLYGELYYPANKAPKAAVILQFGSGRWSAVDYNYLQFLLPLHDIAVFVFDKQGTGKSEGTFTADFSTLADDMVAAVEAIKPRFQEKAIPVGVMGESQGGWVTPLTSIRTDVDFVIASYGLAVSPAEENRLEVMQKLAAGNYDAEVIKSAEKVISVTNTIFSSTLEEGWDELAVLKAKYGHTQWYQELDGDYTGLLANADTTEIDALKELFSFHIGANIDLFYDPVPVLYEVTAPMLWVLAGKDTEAPFEDTFKIVKKLQEDGSRTDIAVFPNAEHGMISVQETEEGIVLLGGHAEGYFELLKDWILKQSVEENYGDALLYQYAR